MATPVIRALSEATIHQIAAGEVIERPANVVKELVENALDAGATRITITCDDGGKELIRVADNGKGMLPEDLRRCWLPHTTSKIRDIDDLESVATMGFRGEALCSMAAVSELTIETRMADAEVGHALTVREGREESLRESPRATGTTISVRQLFLNNPVRRKFLGSGRSEATRILNQITRLALARPEVAFKLIEGQKEVLHLREGTLKHRVGEVLGFHQTESLLPVLWSDGDVRIEGLVSTPQEARQRTTHQHYYVNARSVYSPMLQRALTASYDVLPPGRHPVAVLFITLPPREIDVNIHPTKREIRFLHESRLHWALGQAVTQALRLNTGAPQLDFDAPLPFSKDASPDDGVTESSVSSTSATMPGYAPAFAFQEPQQSRPPAGAPADYEQAGSHHSDPSQAVAIAEPSPRLFEFPSAPAEAILPGQVYLQVHHRFIVFAVSGGMMVVNQQAAHERVLFERALEDLRRPGRFSSQQLLFPEVIELLPEEARLAEEQAPALQALGFELEAFGGRTFQLRGLPGEVPADKAQRTLRDLLHDLLQGDGGRARAGEEMTQRLARAYARVTCIRLGEPLDTARMTGLMDALFATRNPYVSPSGAPVVIRFPLGELHRRFGLKDEGGV
jgi:DNA mismatch repair protein MutL